MASIRRTTLWLLAASILIARPLAAADERPPVKPPAMTTQLPNDPSQLSAAQRAKLAEGAAAARRASPPPRYVPPAKGAAPAETVIPPERAGLDRAVLAARIQAKHDETLKQLRNGWRPAGTHPPIRDKRAFVLQPAPQPVVPGSASLTPAEQAKAAEARKRAPAARKEGAR
jgi:hypothetical protein